MELIKFMDSLHIKHNDSYAALVQTKFPDKGG